MTDPNATPLPPAPDVQAEAARHALPVQRVGLRGLRHPMLYREGPAQAREGVGDFSLGVNLKAEQRGAHLSRLVEIVRERHRILSLSDLPGWLTALRERMDATSVWLEVKFPWVLERAAPVTHLRAGQVYDVWLRAVGEPAAPKPPETPKTDDAGDRSKKSVSGRFAAAAVTARLHDDRYYMGVRVPVTGVCPCSRAVSDFGAHNQRVYVTVEIECATDLEGHPAGMEFDDLCALAESAGSSPVFPLLKRADERHVTMEAFNQPLFVEDVARRAAKALASLRKAGDTRIGSFKVEAVAQESVHAHDAFAIVRG